MNERDLTGKQNGLNTLTGAQKNSLLMCCYERIVRLYLVYKKGDTTDCSNYSAISLLSTSYKILSYILSRLTPYADEIIEDRQCEL
jgi:hypothetical protein